MKKSILILVSVTLILIFNCHPLFAQYILKEADKQYELFNYMRAIDLYTKAYAKKKTVHAARRLAESYRQTQNYQQAESWYAKLANVDHPDPGNILYYAEALRNNSKYEEAKEQYTRYARLNKNATPEQLSLWYSSCDSAIYWMKHPLNIRLENSRQLNSANSDWGAVPYGSGMVFSSERVDGQGKGHSSRVLDFSNTGISGEVYGWTGKPYLQLFLSEGAEIKPFPLAVKEGYHAGAASFNAKNTEMYFSMTRNMNRQERRKSKNEKLTTLRVEIYSSMLKNGQWSTPQPFRYNNISAWSVGDPFLTADGQKLYFVSDKPGGYGGTDIYVCMKQEDGSWGEAVNLGEPVNTSGNERFPFLDGNNNFYFSSDGLPGMGGLDIFKTKLKTSGTRVENMGYPLNSPQDDFAFTIAEESGYLSSNRDGGAGSDDIYSFSFIKQPELVIEGYVLDKESRKPLQNAVISLVNKQTGALLKVPADSNGKYRFVANSGPAYELTAEKTNYKTIRGIEAGTVIRGETFVRRDILLEAITMNTPVKIENIYYDFDKWELRADACKELDKLVKILKDNPSIWIEIASHTDSRGKKEYNQKLSARRAAAVVRYLVSRGIEESRLKSIGYGESRPLNGCNDGVACSEAEYQANRRTEFKIVEQ